MDAPAAPSSNNNHAVTIGLSILSIGLLVAAVCIYIRHVRMQHMFEEEHYRLQHQLAREVVHECRLLDPEAQALKALRLKLLSKPKEMMPIFNPKFNGFCQGWIVPKNGYVCTVQSGDNLYIHF